MKQILQALYEEHTATNDQFNTALSSASGNFDINQMQERVQEIRNIVHENHEAQQAALEQNDADRLIIAWINLNRRKPTGTEIHNILLYQPINELQATTKKYISMSFEKYIDDMKPRETLR